MSRFRLTNIGNTENLTLQSLIDAVVVSALMLSLVWGVFLIDEFMNYGWKAYGLRPRSLEGLLGIITMFFLHGSWDHIVHNTMGFFVLNTLLFYIYRRVAIPVFLAVFFLTPLMVWLFARANNHIGASGVIYGLFGFLFIVGFLSEHPIHRRATLVVTMFYGSLIWWLFPIKPEISWEGHLSGFIVGLACVLWQRDNLPKRAKYGFELEPELPDDPNGFWVLPENRTTTVPVQQSTEETTVTIKYHLSKDQLPKSDVSLPKSK
jgi:membrane associated rhomboid family serine protease